MEQETTRIFIIIFFSISVLTFWNYYQVNEVVSKYITRLTASNNSKIERISRTENKSHNKKLEGIIVAPLYELLLLLKKATSSFGWAIIILTIILRVLIFPLQYISSSFSKRMNDFQNELKKIKTNFKDQPEKIKEESFTLMKKHNLNPVIGFLSMIIQIPIFFCVFKILRESIELKGASFSSLILDLAKPDPLFVLPAISGILIFLQMFLTHHSTKNKSSNRVLILPASVMIFFMLYLPSGVLLYISTGAIMSIIGQYIINRKLRGNITSH